MSFTFFDILSKKVNCKISYRPKKKLCHFFSKITLSFFFLKKLWHFFKKTLAFFFLKQFCHLGSCRGISSRHQHIIFKKISKKSIYLFCHFVKKGKWSKFIFSIPITRVHARTVTVTTILSRTCTG